MASASSNLVSAIRFYVDKIITDSTIGGMLLMLSLIVSYSYVDTNLLPYRLKA